MFRKTNWNEPVVFELGRSGRRGHLLPNLEDEIKKVVGDLDKLIPNSIRRTSTISLPELSEVEVNRHYFRLSEMNYGVDSGLYPLGSCTMKYNPKINESLAALPSLGMIHPYQDEETVQGILEILYTLERWLSEITGMYEVCLQPAAGAQGELLGTLLMPACLKANGQCDQRRK